MDIPILAFLTALLAAIGTFYLMRRKVPTSEHANTIGRAAWSTVLSTPAMLVPAGMAAVAAWLVIDSAPSVANVSEQPYFGFRALPRTDHMVLFIIMSVLVAGFVGLLPPLRSGTKPNGVHFWQGIKDHSLTFLLARFLAGVFVSLAAEIRLGDTFTPIVYAAPSLVLAPLLGTATLHPRRPIAAMHAAVSRVTWDLSATASLLLGQVLILVLTWFVFLGRPDEMLLHVLARNTSVLSFNPFPMMSHLDLCPYGWVAGAALIAVCMVTSTMFMLLYCRRVWNVPTRPTPSP